MTFRQRPKIYIRIENRKSARDRGISKYGAGGVRYVTKSLEAESADDGL